MKRKIFEDGNRAGLRFQKDRETFPAEASTRKGPRSFCGITFSKILAIHANFIFRCSLALLDYLHRVWS